MNLQKPTRPTWIEVSESALRNNLAQIRRALVPGTKLMAAIKANGYGPDGAANIAPILLDAGADYLAVATLGEALELRQANIAAPILVMGYTPDWLVHEAIQQSITLTIFDEESATSQNQAARINRRLVVHVKVNSGMNRLGVTPPQALQLFKHLQLLANLEVEGIFTHFATSDLTDKSFADEQFKRFQQVLDVLFQHSLRPFLAHAANSAALFTMPENPHLDMA